MAINDGRQPLRVDQGVMLTCQEAIAIVGDYLEAALGPALALDLERHLDECDECTAYLNTYRASRELVAAAGWTDMPPALRARLREFLITRLSASRPSV